MAENKVEWRVRASPSGADLLTGEVEVVDGKWRPVFDLPAAITAGMQWYLGHRGLDRAGNAEAWQQVAYELAAAILYPDLPQAIGTKTLSQRFAWLADFKGYFGTSHDPVLERGSAFWPAPTRIVKFDDLPIYTGTGAQGTDFDKRWMGYFGNHVGYPGTQRSGDRLELTEDATYYSAANNDMPRYTEGVEVYAPGVTIANTHADATSGLMVNHGLRLLGWAQNLPTDGSTTDAQAQAQSTRRVFIHGTEAKPFVLETHGAVGRTGLNQQGNAMLVVDPFVNNVIVQDVRGIGARGAGFFGYRARKVWLNRCQSEETWADAFHWANGCQDILMTDCVARRSGDDGDARVRYNGEADHSDTVRTASIRHRVETTGHGRGAVTICNSDVYWDQLYVEGSAAAGFLWDREASSATPAKGIYRVLGQRIHVKGCNWSEQDHGGVFWNNGTTAESVYGTAESLLITDSNPTRNVVRGVGSGTLTITARDVQLAGGPGNATWFGGNNLLGITFDPAAVRTEVAGADTTPPTLVFLTPGYKATVGGTLAGHPTKTSNGVTTDDLGNTGAYRNTMAICFYAGHVLGLTDTGVEVSIGDTVLGTVPKSALDKAGRGYLENVDTTRFVNGQAIVTLRATSASGKTKRTLRRPITIQNATPGSLAGLPSGVPWRMATSTTVS